mmetsp:Transcript_3164/g.8332  ORF Transcript_3164/g.8332 Transcript_3164/m.8332 type:complete len:202 (+) Transcript_3164:414-1019(+)
MWWASRARWTASWRCSGTVLGGRQCTMRGGCLSRTERFCAGAAPRWAKRARRPVASAARSPCSRTPAARAPAPRPRRRGGAPRSSPSTRRSTPRSLRMRSGARRSYRPGWGPSLSGACVCCEPGGRARAAWRGRAAARSRARCARLCASVRKGSHGCSYYSRPRASAAGRARRFRPRWPRRSVCETACQSRARSCGRASRD